MATLTLGRVMIAYGADVKNFQSGSRKVNKSLDKQKAKAKSTGDTIGKMKSGYLLAAAGAAALVAAGVKALNAWSKQEDAVNKLNVALANQGNFSSEASKALQDQASALQGVTRHGDEAILAGQALLATTGLTAEEMKRVTPAVLDFADGMQMDLNSAFQLVTKAAAGQASALSRYGISVTKGKSDSEQFEEALTQLETRFGGMAEAAGTTAGGALAKLSNAVGDVWEQIGKFTEFLLSGFGIGMTDVIGLVERLGQFFGRDLIMGLGMAREVFANTLASMLEGISSIIRTLAKYAQTMNNLPGIEMLVPDGFVAKLQGLSNTTQQFAAGLRQTAKDVYLEAAAATAAGPGNEAMATKLQAAAVAANTLNDNLKETNTVMTQMSQFQGLFREQVGLTAISNEEFAANVALTFGEASLHQQQWGIFSQAASNMTVDANKQAEEAAKRLGITTREESARTEQQLQADLATIVQHYGEYSAEAIAAQEKLDEFRVKSATETNQITLDSMMGLIAGTAGAFASMGEEFKAFAIAQAIISTYLAIAKAMTTLPWPANMVSAAGAAAAGFANVAKIRSSNATSARFGTPALDFQNFGAESPAVLHGNEAVIPQGSGHRLAAEIARAMPTPTEGGGAMSSGGGDITIRVPVNIDGKMIDEIVERRTKTGNMRVHENAVRTF